MVYNGLRKELPLLKKRVQKVSNQPSPKLVTMSIVMPPFSYRKCAKQRIAYIFC
jgi:hypothetical protein